MQDLATGKNHDMPARWLELNAMKSSPAVRDEMQAIQDGIIKRQDQGPVFYAGEELIIKGGRFKVKLISKNGIMLQGKPSGASWAKKTPIEAMLNVAHSEWRAARGMSRRKLIARLDALGVCAEAWSTTDIKACIKGGIYEAYRLRGEELQDIIELGGPDCDKRIDDLLIAPLGLYPFKDFMPENSTNKR